MPERLPDWLTILLPRLCCPETRQPLRAASAGELTAANLEGPALAREDGTRLFPIDDGIPLLLPDAVAPSL